jgi:hypothetical protein
MSRRALVAGALGLLIVWWRVGTRKKAEVPRLEDPQHTPASPIAPQAVSAGVAAGAPDPDRERRLPAVTVDRIAVARAALEAYTLWARYPPDSRPLEEHPGHEVPAASDNPSDPPAIFSGEIAETLEEGSLVLTVGVRVYRSGRYEIVGRVDDATGRGFALLRARVELRAGAEQVRLRIFGKLARDQAAEAPFQLRDLEGLRRLEDADPDVEPMPTLRGAVHTTGSPPSVLSADEWRSDDKQRHLDRLSRALDHATTRAAGEKQAGAP